MAIVEAAHLPPLERLRRDCQAHRSCLAPVMPDARVHERIDQINEEDTLTAVIKMMTKLTPWMTGKS